MKSGFSQTIQGVKNRAGSLIHQATSSVTTETQNTLDKLENLVGESGQTLSHLTTDLNQSVSGLDEAATMLKTSVLEATGGAVQTITETSHQAASVFKETTLQATDALNNATNLSVHKLNAATDSLTQTAAKTKLVLDETLQKTEQLSGAISYGAQEVVVNSMQGWMAEHPIVAWIVAHPLWSIALIVFAIFLCWSLLGAVVQLTQKAWIALLQAPLKLIQMLWSGLSQSFHRTDASSLMLPDVTQPDVTQPASQREAQERLPQILSRLEALHQEQEALMKEMRSMLVSKH